MNDQVAVQYTLKKRNNEKNEFVVRSRLYRTQERVRLLLGWIMQEKSYRGVPDGVSVQIYTTGSQKRIYETAALSCRKGKCLATSTSAAELLNPVHAVLHIRLQPIYTCRRIYRQGKRTACTDIYSLSILQWRDPQPTRVFLLGI